LRACYLCGGAGADDDEIIGLYHVAHLLSRIFSLAGSATRPSL
jgi:hypothetical protein